MAFDDTGRRFLVLRNGEGQYSLWPESLDVPPGWTVVQTAEDKASALAYVEGAWTDMRPLSLQRSMAASSQ